MVGINNKPEMSEFEKGVVHGRSLALAEDADQKCMTSLTDKMEKLWKENIPAVSRDPAGHFRALGFDQGVTACIKLALAEAAVVKRELEDAYDRGKIDGNVEKYNDGYFAGVIAERKNASKTEAAVVGDWEAEFDKQFVEIEDGACIYEPGDLKGIKTFITTLLAAKDREREEAIQSIYEYINRGQFSTPKNPCEAWEKLNLRDKAEIVWHLLKALDR